MDVVYPRVAGLDIHKKLIVACRIIPGTGAQVQREVRSFGATTTAIEELSDWLAEGDVTHVAMEATGVYWKPLFNLLEQRFTLVLANAQHIKAVPGRKTDVKDSEWIADLLRHGLIKGSFVPDRAQRELRELTRYRTSLVRERAAVANRIQKTVRGRISSSATWPPTCWASPAGRCWNIWWRVSPIHPASLGTLADGWRRSDQPYRRRCGEASGPISVFSSSNNSGTSTAWIG